MRIISLLLSVSLIAFSTNILRAADKVIVHEWGTFTSLQDEQGQAIGGINVDDEPVPYFVHSVAIGVAPQYGVGGWHNLGLPPYQNDKAWISGDPRVTMRLETPVLYIYPPQGQTPQSVPPLDFHVDFHGGVLSQFYPHADFAGLPLRKFPGQPQLDGKFPYIDKDEGLTEKTVTSLDWKSVKLGSSVKPIEIDDKVWTTPREVSAPVLQVKFSAPGNSGAMQDYTQAEHFLFYRGVGHLDSLLKIRHASGNDEMMVIAGNVPNLDLAFPSWMVEIRPNGSCAFRSVTERIKSVSIGVFLLPRLPGSFSGNDFSADNLIKLKASMQETLVKEGLYPDEASAMLRTWELSYFKSPGLRFFYIAPRAWVDKVLPLKITGALTEITRVMIGRIELVTDAQRTALGRLAVGPCPDLAAVKKAAQDAINNGKLSDYEKRAYDSGEQPLSDLGITIPPLVQDYLSLGRFRDALIVHAQQEHPSPALAQFITDNQLVPQIN